MFKYIIAVLTGLIVGLLIIFYGNLIYVNIEQKTAIRDGSELMQYFREIPLGVFWVRISAHSLGMFFAGLVASLVSAKGKYVTGISTFMILFIAIIYFVFDNYYPTWFVVSDISIAAILGFAGVVVGSTRYT
ncbi:MAG TPA: hypothetical protein P5235_05580 [Saprospiraceae bacterium]|nr:hypothetical protein [Saprospiraceae bacterium]MCB9328222.1 hypothetical protein [Lewinellaceae bacterium]HPK09112.1 hypothetical protein [Saprospiraceae bacterium]HRX28833.1 hypothetical protein [Saprospiraceae bacterium]